MKEMKSGGVKKAAVTAIKNVKKHISEALSQSLKHGIDIFKKKNPTKTIYGGVMLIEAGKTAVVADASTGTTP